MPTDPDSLGALRTVPSGVVRFAVSDDLRIATLADAEAAINSLRINDVQQAKRIRTLEKMIEIKDSPLWKRILFWIDGWAPWYRIVDRPQWRPWRRWWTS